MMTKFHILIILNHLFLLFIKTKIYSLPKEIVSAQNLILEKDSTDVLIIDSVCRKP